jgi:predicted ATPase
VRPPRDFDTKEARFRQFDSVVRFLEAAAHARPLLLLLEDLHWADASTLLLLKFAAREMLGAPILIVATYRDDATRDSPVLSEVLSELSGRTTCEHIVLTGLSRADVVAIVERELAEAADAALVDAVFDKTEGNPFFVGEVVRFLKASASRAGGAIAEVHELPDGIREAIGRRLTQLPPETVDVLSFASVIGREFDLRLLRDASRRPLDEITNAIEGAVAARILREVPGDMVMFRFEHALIRQTLYESQPAARRLRAHHAVAQSLEQRYSDDRSQPLSALAYHFGEAARLEPNDEAVKYARRAGERAGSVLAFDEAVTEFKRALSSIEQARHREERERAELLVALGESQVRAGTIADGRATFLTAARVAEQCSATESLALSALGFSSVSAIGNVDEEAVALLERALSALPQHHPLTARVKARLANALYLSGEDARIDRLSAEAVALAREVGDPELLAETLELRHGCVNGPGIFPERLAIADEVIVCARAAGNIEYELLGHALRTFDLLSLSRFADATATQMRMTRLIEDVRGRWGQWQPRSAAMWALIDGDLERAEEQATEALRLSNEHQDPDGLQLFMIQLFHIRREQDRANEILPGLQMLRDQTAANAAATCGLVALLAEQGRADEAADEFEAVAQDNYALLPNTDFRPLSLVLLADACVMLDDRDRAEEVFQLLRPYAGETQVFGPGLDCYGSAARAVGALATLTERYDEAEALLRTALDVNTRLHSRRWIAHTQVDLARMLLTRGDLSDTAEVDGLLDAATRTADEAGLALVKRKADLVRAML